MAKGILAFLGGLIILLLTGLILTDLWGARLAPTLPRRMEQELSQLLKVPVTIHSVEGGLFRPFRYRDVHISDRLRLAMLTVNLRWWDLVRARFPQEARLSFTHGAIELAPGMILTPIGGRVTIADGVAQMKRVRGSLWGMPILASGTVPLSRSRGGLDLVVAMQGGPAGGTWRFTGSLNRPQVEGELRIGYLSVPILGRLIWESRPRVRFDVAMAGEHAIHGHLDLAQGRIRGLITTNWADEPWGYTVSLTRDHRITAEIEIERGFIGRHRLAGRAVTVISVEHPERPPLELSCTFQIDPVEWDGLPSYPMRGRVHWREDQLMIDRVQWGSIYELFGTLRTEFPGEVRLKAKMVKADLERGEAIFFPPKSFTGMMNGWLELGGQLPFPHLKAELVLTQGRLGWLTYEKCVIKMRGTWPVVQVEDSELVRADRWLKLEGEIDLRRLHHGELLRQLVAKADQEVVWEGERVFPAIASDEVRWERQLGKLRVHWIKSEDTSFTYQEVPKDVELDVQVSEKNKMQMKMQGEEQYLGVGRKVKW